MFDEDARHGEKVVYTLNNPHPLHGKDPNIINELGHTHYPKWIEHPTEKRVDHVTTHFNSGDAKTTVIETSYPKRVLVQDADEEAELMGKPAKAKKDDWKA